MLTLIWAVVSYFGLFDFGLGRTLTLQMVRAESQGVTVGILLGRCDAFAGSLCSGCDHKSSDCPPDRPELTTLSADE